jgi:hypothetical protein
MVKLIFIIIIKLTVQLYCNTQKMNRGQVAKGDQLSIHDLPNEV